MINIQDKSACSGCTACSAVCGRNAITMTPDGMGFKYPVVDMEKCVECGLCEKVCAFKPDYRTPENFDSPRIYAARQKEIAEIEKSRSGGVFAAISDVILEEGGVVYGAGYDSSFRVLHKKAVTKEQRDEFRGSKYVQSDMDGIFRQVAEDLKAGLNVLFSGTPCQTAGLQSFLTLRKVNREKLFVCDIVCHGVPSPFIWRDYLDYIQRKEGKKVIGVNFRDKSKLGWAAHKESFKFDDGYTYTYTYTYTFCQHIMFRHSCGVCHYTNLRRTGDITLADFWGWEKIDKSINADNKGVSLIFVNTPKGADMFDKISVRLNAIPTTADKCMQPNLQHPSEIHPQRNKFEDDYIKYGFEKTMKRHALMGNRYKMKILINAVNKNSIKRFLYLIYKNLVKS